MLVEVKLVGELVPDVTADALALKAINDVNKSSLYVGNTWQTSTVKCSSFIRVLSVRTTTCTVLMLDGALRDMAQTLCLRMNEDTNKMARW